MVAPGNRPDLTAHIRRRFWQSVTLGVGGLVVAALGAAALSLLQDRSAGMWPDLFRFGWIIGTTLAVLGGFTLMAACLARVAGEFQAHLDDRSRGNEHTRPTS